MHNNRGRMGKAILPKPILFVILAHWIHTLLFQTGKTSTGYHFSIKLLQGKYHYSRNLCHFLEQAYVVAMQTAVTNFCSAVSTKCHTVIRKSVVRLMNWCEWLCNTVVLKEKCSWVVPHHAIIDMCALCTCRILR